MNQPQIVNRVTVRVILVEDNDAAREIAHYNSPVAVPLPAVGDEIGFPDNSMEKIGTTKTVFTVIRRRHPIPLDQRFSPEVYLFVK
uniref:hypothetical protein n=1 Tax=Candidatus Electronema sp. TaxID=2698783 RepID=UPI0040569D86